MTKVTRPVYVVRGFHVTAAQRDAGLARMVGFFSRHDMMTALRDAGVHNLPGQILTVASTVDRMLQTARQSGQIRVATGRGRGMWERLADVDLPAGACSSNIGCTVTRAVPTNAL